MRVFLTGGTGFIGSAIIPELIDGGHKVVGLARSEASAQVLARAGAEVYRGNLEDAGALQSAVATVDAVIHTAFEHDFSQFAKYCEIDRKVIEAFGSALAGTDRRLLLTSITGAAAVAPGAVATEDDAPVSSAVHLRAASEEAASLVREKGCRSIVLRMPQVHDTRKQGLWSFATQIARDKGVSAYIGDGLNRWPAAHVVDTAKLYSLALEKGRPGSIYHAVAEEGVRMRDIANAIGERLKLPVVALSEAEGQAHFGWLSRAIGMDLPASSDKTRQELNWNSQQPGLIADLMHAEV